MTFALGVLCAFFFGVYFGIKIGKWEGGSK